MKRLTIAAVVLLAIPSGFARAQAPAADDSHHPPQTAAPTPEPAESAPTPGQPGMGAMPMMDMMRGMNHMSMMNMMNMMETMRSMRMMGPGGPGMATIDRVEGRIAFLHAELKITDAQTDAWNVFADALRTNAKKLGDMRSTSMMSSSGAGQLQAPTIIERVESQERWMQARLEGIRTMKLGLARLYESLSDDQKKSANELLAPHMGMGMMTMTRAQIGPDQMRPGEMGPNRH